jgi:hypothetical protein
MDELTGTNQTHHTQHHKPSVAADGIRILRASKLAKDGKICPKFLARSAVKIRQSAATSAASNAHCKSTTPRRLSIQGAKNTSKPKAHMMNLSKEQEFGRMKEEATSVARERESEREREREREKSLLSSTQRSRRRDPAALK